MAPVDGSHEEPSETAAASVPGAADDGIDKSPPITSLDDGDPSTTECAQPHSLSSTISRNRCIFVTGIILISHALFIWGQVDPLWGQFVYATADVGVNATSNMTQAAMQYALNDTSASLQRNQSYQIGSWSYADMLSELWIYSKVTAVFLFVFSAFWPHFKLLLLHVYFYRPFPSKPRMAALYWLDSFGKFSLADVCATCMLFLLLNVETEIDVGALASHGGQLMGEMMPYIGSSGVIEGLSNQTQARLDKAGTWASEELIELSDSIFANDDPTKYKLLLEAGCSKFYNNGDSCVGTPFYEPATIAGGTAGLMMKCMRIRNDKCSQCECIVNGALYNHLIPGDLVRSKANDAMSVVFAKALAAIKPGDIDFQSWLDVGGTASLGMYITIHPAFLGFTFGVILSIAASLLVTHVEEKDSMKRHRNASSVSEALGNAGVKMDESSRLFDVGAGSTRRLKKMLALLSGVGIIPLIFFAIYIEMFKLSIAGLLEELVLMQASATEKLYSIIDTVTTVNDGSGYGKTFAVFYGTMMLGVPMLRATLLAIVSVIPLSPLWHVRLAAMSNNVGSFIAWEPFFICVVLLMVELPSLTENTINPEQCEQIEEKSLMSSLIAKFGLDDTITCFVMRFDMLPAIALFVVAWAFMTAFNAIAWKNVLRRYDPFGTHSRMGDEGGPYCTWRQCCYYGCFRKDQREEVPFNGKSEPGESEKGEGSS